MLPGSIRNWTKAYNHQELDIYHTRLLYKLGMSFIIDDILNLKKFFYLTITIVFYFLCIFIYHSFIYIYLALVWVVVNDMYEWQTWWNRWYCSTNYTEKVISSIASIFVLFCFIPQNMSIQISRLYTDISIWI